MKIQCLIRSAFIEIVCYLYVILFVYAAVSKIIDFQNFQAQIGQSPLLSIYAGIISYGVLLLEIILAALLCFQRFRLGGLYGAFTLMILFTVYIFIILNYSSDIPCSCGGILEKMGWKEHFIFNCCFVLLALLAILFYPGSRSDSVAKLSNPGKKLVFMLSISVLSIAALIVMYESSERRMHQDNPFIRKYVTGYAERSGEMKLHTASLYFAGTDNTQLYLGDSRAPLHIFEVDTMLKSRKHHVIQLENDKLPFTRIQVQVKGKNFYVYDGTVPVIFKGSILDWKAKIVMQPNDMYFTNALATSENEIIFKQYQPGNQRTVIGCIDLNDRNAVRYRDDILQKQIDGLFDVDGTMLYNKSSESFIYLYYYRNQFTVTNHKLRLSHRWNTIDTNRIAGIKTSYDSTSGKRQLSSPGHVINKIAATYDNLLLVNSTARGKFEADRMWEIASIIDVYDFVEGEYLFSFYIYNGQESKLRDMMPFNSNLFVLVGHELQRYEINKSFNKTRK